MSVALAILLAWLALGVLAGPIVGRWIGFGLKVDTAAEREHERKRAINS